MWISMCEKIIKLYIVLLVHLKNELVYPEADSCPLCLCHLPHGGQEALEELKVLVLLHHWWGWLGHWSQQTPDFFHQQTADFFHIFLQMFSNEMK